MKVKFVLCEGYSRNDDRTELVDFEDDATEEEIEKAWQDWVWEYTDGYWEKT